MGWTVADDQEAFYRSQGWSGTRWDSPRDDGDIYDTGSKARTDYFTNSLIKAAGDDGKLNSDEFMAAIHDGPDKYMYNPDTKSNALARFGSSTGFTIDEDLMKSHDLAYEDGDIIQKIDGAYTGPNRAYKDSVSYIRTEDDPHDSEGDSYNFWRWAGAGLPEEEEEEVVVTEDLVEEKPTSLADDPQGDPTTTKEHSDNQKEYLKFTYGDDDTSVKIKKGFDDPAIKAALLGEFMKRENLNADGSYKYVTPGRRLGIDLTYPEQRGAIPYVSHAQYMKNFIKAPQLGSASDLAYSLKSLSDLKA